MVYPRLFAAVSSPPLALHRLTYLVVDDLELMRTVTMNQLRAMGCEKIYGAKNGVEALRVLRSQNIDAVLADWNMPVMTGLELLKTVRADPKLAKLPFLMITAEAERQRIEEVIAAGVSSLLVKPYTAGSLRSRLEKVLAGGARPATPLASRPAAPPRSPPPDDLPGQLGAVAPTEILVTDDTPASLAVLVHLFKDEYQVRTARSGEEALAQCTQQRAPDLVLMDVMMPGLDGFETVRRLREHPAAAQIPVIFVTGADDDEALIKGMELGAVDFVSKQTNPRVLRTRVRNFMRFVQLRKQLQADYDAMLDAARLREDVEQITRHDLKGSLAGIVGMVQSLAGDEDMAARHVSQLRLVEQTAQQVIDMVNLSSELYKMETGRFQLKAGPVPVGELLHRIAELARTAFADKHLTIEVDTDTPVGVEMPGAQGDAMLCYSLFQNLVKNACEAAPPRSRVSILLKDEDPLRVLIQNQGVVPPAIRERFFDKYVTGGKAGGTGLGTYSARLLAEAQKGQIRMNTDDATQTTVLTVLLPRQGFGGPGVAS